MQDIQWDRSQFFIEGGKGKKDRVVMLGEVMKKMLQDYVEAYQPSFWLFEGQQAGHPYFAASLRNIVKKAARAAGITQKLQHIRYGIALQLIFWSRVPIYASFRSFWVIEISRLLWFTPM